MKTIKELDFEIQSTAIAIDYCHRSENGYAGSQEELNALIAEQEELIKLKDVVMKNPVNKIKNMFGMEVLINNKKNTF